MDEFEVLLSMLNKTWPAHPRDIVTERSHTLHLNVPPWNVLKKRPKKFEVHLYTRNQTEFPRPQDLVAEKKYVQFLTVEPWNILVNKPKDLPDQLNRFLDYPALSRLTIVVTHFWDFKEEWLKQALQYVAASCETLGAKLGNRLRFDVDVAFIPDGQLGDKACIVRRRCGLDKLRRLVDKKRVISN